MSFKNPANTATQTALIKSFLIAIKTVSISKKSGLMPPMEIILTAVICKIAVMNTVKYNILFQQYQNLF
ncbi:MAG: hypothetical protein CO036_01420 [Candidatus Omnitrophica bacterium CG_4_9_14_0_2_um_filter_43_12]|nr:MAG: hypothetical protein CO036_01420 [Candidatus Omnitrophica bacterium CG_4_9_14_0_2_um_filter_43_12]